MVRQIRGIPPPRILERALGRLGASEALDKLGQVLGGAFARLVRPGPMKDLLSGTWLGHPLHPLLTDIPIGAWTSALVIDVLGDETAAEAADALVGLGVLAAVPTAISGLSDLTDVVSDEDRRIGAAHAAGNVAAVAMYAASYLARRGGRRGLGMLLSGVGVTTLTATGFLGGHLAYRRGLGVDQNAFDQGPERWTPVIDADAVAEGKPRRVEHDGTSIMLYRRGETIFALANRCGHRGGPLHEGRITEDGVECPWHMSTFALADGSIVRGPATAPQPTYDVRLAAGKIEVRARRGPAT